MITRRWLGAVAVSAFLCACHDTAAPEIDPAGVYQLTTVNDQALPVTLVLSAPPDTVILVAHHGTLSLGADGSYAAETCYFDAVCQTRDLETGAWTRLGNRITLEVHAVPAQVGPGAIGSGYTRTLTFATRDRLTETPVAGNFVGFIIAFER